MVRTRARHLAVSQCRLEAFRNQSRQRCVELRRGGAFGRIWATAVLRRLCCCPSQRSRRGGWDNEGEGRREYETVVKVSLPHVFFCAFSLRARACACKVCVCVCVREGGGHITALITALSHCILDLRIAHPLL